MKYSDAT